MATLKFMPAGQFEGFRTSGVSAYNDVSAEIIVRELVQNALDASIQAGRKTDVRFEIETVPASEIPALGCYRTHFEQSVNTQRRAENLDQAEDIVGKIRNTLSEPHLKILWISDSGIGLNPDNMRRLLGDGQTGKSDPRLAGSYGNGHITAFPASDLQYIVYGAVCAKERYAAGHAILATHELEGVSYAKDGFLVHEIKQDLFDRFTFHTGDRIPKLISRHLDSLSQRTETGSVVGILGFNDFLEDDLDSVEQIENVIATHFAPAIHNGDMTVKIISKSLKDGVEATLNAGRLDDVLKKSKSQSRRKRGQRGPAGGDAYEVLQTLRNGIENIIPTSFGPVTVLFREFEVSGNTKGHLFRSGMWITDQLPKMSSAAFGNVKPFHALILLDPDEAEGACALIRKSEGPSHIHIEGKRIKNPNDRRGFDRFFDELRNGILELATEVEAEEFDPGFFSIDVSGAGTMGRRSRVGVGRPEPVDQPPPPNTVDPNGEEPRPPRKNPAGIRVDRQFSAVRLEEGVQVRLKPLEDAAYAELRLTVESGADTTCDNPIPASRLQVEPGSTVNGEPVTVRQIDGEEGSVAIGLGAINADEAPLDVWLACRDVPLGRIGVELVARKAAPEDTRL